MVKVRLLGGMGNQMFQYAIGRALSLKQNVPLKLDTTFLDHRIKMSHFMRSNFSFRNFDLDVFNIQAEIAKPYEISFWNRPFFWGPLILIIDVILRKLAFLPGWEKKVFSFDERVLKLGPNTYLEGFWQSPKYFEGYENVIRKDFSLKNEPADNIKHLVEEIRNLNSLCIHVRRGDYVGNKFHEVVDNEYYKKGIKYILEKVHIEKIYVFSDDIEWCKDNLSFEILTMFVGAEYTGLKGEGHMFLMSQCRHFIIANSSFSWWGAWLANYEKKIVICPKQWFKDTMINIDDLIPESWVRI